jgi:hypothetical protein
MWLIHHLHLQLEIVAITFATWKANFRYVGIFEDSAGSQHPLHTKAATAAPECLLRRCPWPSVQKREVEDYCKAADLDITAHEDRILVLLAKPATDRMCSEPTKEKLEALGCVSQAFFAGARRSKVLSLGDGYICGHATSTDGLGPNARQRASRLRDFMLANPATVTINTISEVIGKSLPSGSGKVPDPCRAGAGNRSRPA